MTNDIQLDRLIAAFEKLHEPLSRMAKTDKVSVRRGGAQDGARSEAAKKIERDLSKVSQTMSSMNSRLLSVGNGLGSLGKNTESLNNGFAGLIRTMPVLGAAFGALFGSAQALSKTYGDMVSTGQNFGGSMIEMGRQAAQSGLSLAEFSAMVQKNSTAAAVLGGAAGDGAARLGQLQKGVRDNIKQFGYYSMSLADISDLSGEYADSLRLQGAAANMNSARESKNIADFAGEITTFAAVTGKARKDIIRMTMETLKDGTTAARMAQNGTEEQRRALERSVAFFSSMPGTAGDMLGKMVSQAFVNGGAVFTDEADTFIKAGASSLLGAIDGVARGISAGANGVDELFSSLDQIKEYDRQNRSYLMIQARAGNQEAKKVLAMLAEVRDLNTADYAAKLAAAKNQGAITKMMGSLEGAFAEISGKFREGLFGMLGSLENGNLDENFGKFVEQVKAFSFTIGTSLGTFIKSFMANGDLGKTLDTVKAVVVGIGSFASSVAIAVKIFAPVVGAMTEGLSMVAGFFNQMSNYIGEWGTALVALGAFFTGKLLKNLLVSGIANLFTSSGPMRINAPAVYVNGEPVGGGLSLPDRGNRRNGSRAGTRARAAGRNGRNWVNRNMGKVPGSSAVANGVGALGRGAGAVVDGVSRAGGAVGRFARGGLLGVGTGLASAGMDLLPDFRGKDTIQSMMDYGGMGASIGMLFGPLGAAAGGVLGAGFGLIRSNWDSVVETLHNPIDTMGGWLGGAASWVGDMAKTVGGFLFDWSPVKLLTNNWSKVTGGFGAAVDGVGGAISGAVTWAGGTARAIGGFLFDNSIFGAIYNNWSSITGAFGSAVESVGGTVKSAVEWAATTASAIGGFLFDNSIFGAIYNNWSSITGAFGSAVDSVTGAIQGAVQWAGTTAATLGRFMFDWSPFGLIVNNWSSITSGFDTAVGAIGGMISGALSWAGSIASTIGGFLFDHSIFGAVYNNWGTITDSISSVFTGLGNWFGKVFEWIGWAKDKIDGYVDFVRGSRVARWLGMGADTAPTPTSLATPSPTPQVTTPSVASARPEPAIVVNGGNNRMEAALTKLTEQQAQQTEMIAALMNENNRLTREANRLFQKLAMNDGR